MLTRLLSDGASDAWLTPILMKKGRPAHTLNVLCAPNLADGLRQTIYTETTTLGIRQHTVNKHAALRGFAEIDMNGDRSRSNWPTVAARSCRPHPNSRTSPGRPNDSRIPERQVLDQAKSAAAAAGLVEGGLVPLNFPFATGSNHLVVPPDTSAHSHPLH